MVVQRVRLDQVYDIEPVILSCLGIGDSEVVPLSIASGVVVWLQNQVILILVHLDGSPEVATLEPRLKDQSVVVWTLRNVEWNYFSFRWLSLLVWRWVN